MNGIVSPAPSPAMHDTVKIILSHAVEYENILYDHHCVNGHRNVVTQGEQTIKFAIAILCAGWIANMGFWARPASVTVSGDDIVGAAGKVIGVS